MSIYDVAFREKYKRFNSYLKCLLLCAEQGLHFLAPNKTAKAEVRVAKACRVMLQFAAAIDCESQYIFLILQFIDFLFAFMIFLKILLCATFSIPVFLDWSRFSEVF